MCERVSRYLLMNERIGDEFYGFSWDIFHGVFMIFNIVIIQVVSGAVLLFVINRFGDVKTTLGVEGEK